MSDGEPLFSLAALAGVELAYFDLLGHRHATPAETARAILDALGIQAGSPGEAASSLAALEEEPWREALPPVVIGREGSTIAFALHAGAEQLAARPFSCSVRLEDGRVQPCRGAVHVQVPEKSRKIDGCIVERRIVLLPHLPSGYHRIEGGEGWEHLSAPLIVAPRRCFLVPGIARGNRIWGVSAQLYGLRTESNLGVGDFGDLAALLDWACARGADAVGINPLHALFPDAPRRDSPYSPNSRRYLNPIYLDIGAVPDFEESQEAQAILRRPEVEASIAAARDAACVDYEAVWAVKRPILEALYRNFREWHAPFPADGRATSFVAFRAHEGAALERFSLHAALSEAFGSEDWRRWPAGFHGPASADCLRFAHDHLDRLLFHQYLQWQCDLQLASASTRAREQGLQIGIYGDLAIGSAPDGADVWSHRDVFVAGAHIGAPPDSFNEAGQNWGIAPINPLRMRKTGYAEFIALLRANMRHAGALRIDHVMGLQRQFWVPSGFPATAGAYVRYPFEDLLAILALESQRNGCLVVGEDLGTVAKGFRDRMAGTNVLSYRVLYFEVEDDRFKPPNAYPALAAACVSTHDLPTLRGFWEQTDLADRKAAGLYHSESAYLDACARRHDRKHALILALQEAGLLPPGLRAEMPQLETLTPELAEAVHRYLARSDARLFIVQIDDIAGEASQANMPGTVDSYPNWRRRLSVSLAQLGSTGTGKRIVEVARQERPGGGCP